jgi:hypothetical protein
MPLGVEIRPIIDERGEPVYRVTVSVGGAMSVVRDFKSKEDAERFVSAERTRLGKGPKHA